MTGKHVTDSINTKKSRIGDYALGILPKKSHVGDFIQKDRHITEYSLNDDGTFTQTIVKRPY
jgi:hypothetical protein